MATEKWRAKGNRLHPDTCESSVLGNLFSTITAWSRFCTTFIRVRSLWSLDAGPEGLSFFLIKMGLWISVTFLESFYLVWEINSKMKYLDLQPLARWPWVLGISYLQLSPSAKMIWSKNVCTLLNRGTKGTLNMPHASSSKWFWKLILLVPPLVLLSSCSFFPCWVIIDAAFQMKNVCQNA
jgi:hypothetical protein